MDEIWLLFDKSQYGKKYNGETIGNQPMKAISFDSAYVMYAQGKAVQTTAPGVAEKKSEEKETNE